MALAALLLLPHVPHRATAATPARAHSAVHSDHMRGAGMRGIMMRGGLLPASRWAGNHGQAGRRPSPHGPPLVRTMAGRTYLPRRLQAQLRNCNCNWRPEKHEKCCPSHSPNDAREIPPVKLRQLPLPSHTARSPIATIFGSFRAVSARPRPGRVQVAKSWRATAHGRHHEPAARDCACLRNGGRRHRLPLMRKRTLAAQRVHLSPCRRALGFF